MHRIARFFRRLRGTVERLLYATPSPAAKTALLGLGVASTAALTLVRVATDARFTFSLLLLVPTMLVAWYLGQRWGLAMAALAVTGWLVADLAAGSAMLPADAYVNAAVRALVFGLVAAAFAGLREAHRQLTALAHYDPLTGLANRRLFAMVLDQERRRARRYHRPLSIACLDLDAFKPVNDRYGHSAGDRVLAAIAQSLQGALREVDFAARLGGDEFAILLPDSDEASARTVVSKLRAAWQALPACRDYGVGVSIGVATFAGPPPPADEMLAAADRLLYEAKRSGRDATRYATAGPEVGPRVATASSSDGQRA
jgi:diguanylate cyclase (GGDEF)-like protein